MLALSNMAGLLGAEGVLVQDYLNGKAVLPDLPMQSAYAYDGVVFDIEKTWQQPHIVKKIKVTDGEQNLEFEEKVRVYEAEELMSLHREAGLEPIEVFGDYGLGEFKPLTSPRMIIVSKKKK